MSKYTVSKDIGKKDERAMRDVYCDNLIELAKEDDNIVVLDADLINAIGVKRFKEEFPGRLFDCGISEANMIGMACGLSIQGKIPFTHSFAPFTTRRVADQIFVSGVYNKANVKMIGSDPGIIASFNGGTHMPFEDMGLLRGFPEMTLVEPCDTVQLHDLLPKIAKTYGMFYIRLIRKGVNVVYEKGSTFEIGKAATIRDGSDVTLVASGYMTVNAYKASELLEKEGISARVLDSFTWKPLDEEAIIKAANETGALVSCENHNIVNGLGSAIADCLAKNKPAPLEMVGVQDLFGEVGDVAFLEERFNLRPEDIVKAAKTAIKRKQN